MKKIKVFVSLALVIAMMVVGVACTQTTPEGAAGTDASNADAAVETVGAAVGEMTAGAKEPKNGTAYKIGMSSSVLVYNSYITISNSVEEYAKAEGWECVVTNADGDLAKQISDMEDLAAQGCDIIFINCTDPEMLTPTINTIVEGGTPVVALDGMLSNETNLLTTITANNAQNGYQCGQWAAQKLGSSTMNAIVISGAMGSTVGQERRAGVIEGFTEYAYQNYGDAHVNVVAQYYTDWYADESIKAIEDALARGVDFNVIISEADVMLLPIYEELVGKGIADKYLFVSTADAQKEAIELCLTADNYCTGLNSFTQQASIGIEVAKEYFEGRTKFPELTYTESACIEKSNAEKYFDPDAIF